MCWRLWVVATILLGTNGAQKTTKNGVQKKEKEQIEMKKVAMRNMTLFPPCIKDEDCKGISFNILFSLCYLSSLLHRY